jgi:hypothetical protein
VIAIVPRIVDHLVQDFGFAESFIVKARHELVRHHRRLEASAESRQREVGQADR